MLVISELHRDKRIARDNEYSESDDEGESPSNNIKRGRNEHSYKIGTKRPKLTEDLSVKNATNGKPGQKQGGVIASPLPPEPSPITPLPSEDPTPSHSKGGWPGAGKWLHVIVGVQYEGEFSVFCTRSKTCIAYLCVLH